jgi:hypothetical protein
LTELNFTIFLQSREFYPGNKKNSRGKHINNTSLSVFVKRKKFKHTPLKTHTLFLFAVSDFAEKNPGMQTQNCGGTRR